jgi:hypothetical protein
MSSSSAWRSRDGSSMRKPAPTSRRASTSGCASAASRCASSARNSTCSLSNRSMTRTGWCSHPGSTSAAARARRRTRATRLPTLRYTHAPLIPCGNALRHAARPTQVAHGSAGHTRVWHRCRLMGGRHAPCRVDWSAEFTVTVVAGAAYPLQLPGEYRTVGAGIGGNCCGQCVRASAKFIFVCC